LDAFEDVERYGQVTQALITAASGMSARTTGISLLIDPDLILSV
jgi:hypothetical protein